MNFIIITQGDFNMKINKLILVYMSFFIVACEGESETVFINTPTIQCGMCQKTIEMGLKKIQGVNSSNVDLETKKTKVIYTINKSNIKTIEKAIADLGYQANDQLADPIAYEKLPACCQIGGMDHL